MIDYSLATLEEISVHHVGNKNNEQDLITSASPLPYPEGKVNELLLKFFLSPFSLPEFNAFTFTNEDFKLNPVYNYAKEIFERPDSFHFQTVNIAKHLYELSTHPQIKSGDVLIARFNNLNVENQTVKGIAIFKVENTQSFLKVKSNGGLFDIYSDDGISINKPDKGCLILEMDEDTGYRVCVVDKTNKSGETRYWTEEFLRIKPRSDEFHHTRNFLNLAKDFVTQGLSENFEVNKADQIDLLNRSVEYFKTNDVFEKEKFEQEVFQEPAMIKAFQNFDETYRIENQYTIEDNFEISAPAVKKQAKVFKSVLKLDKNFHIYIHGNRELIERGTDSDGRKYYKIYFSEEQ